MTPAPSVHAANRTPLPVTARTYVGTLNTSTNCGATAVAHTVTYDRGFEAVLDSIDARNQPSRYEYDGFGRLFSTTFANPAQPGVLAPLPSMTVYYWLPENADVEPYGMIGVSVQNGPDPSTDSTVGKWFVSDGLGRTLLTLAQADPSAGDAGECRLDEAIAPLEDRFAIVVLTGVALSAHGRQGWQRDGDHARKVAASGQRALRARFGPSKNHVRDGMA
jgi:YD repeat-containing protein